ncbi:uncharacterized protein E0L32_007012 [Thyridium curvatum]|uniref:lytic cellulose monooxygenase (C4-dehydrogenating) n=1 Tax=Thyridium curvatum TaxID=1093900 RepID=A0A507ANJ2_9PEZI|nr:uncharacterized protein E0L32_007012 [Thyridium curvatum]TPX12365.1 hypothetical protein E0L32_007012 [Thyridium curvatum]
MRSSAAHTMLSVIAAILPSSLLLAPVAAHSHIAYVVVDGLLYPGFDPRRKPNPANVVGWSTTVEDDGFVPPSNYSKPDIICHLNGSPAAAHVPVRPGDKMHIQWNGWPLSHVGPVMSYLAPCSGKAGCADVNKTALEFFKIDDGAPVLLNRTGGPGTRPGVMGQWVTDLLIAANNSWVVEIPPQLAPGAYVLRHELIALHYAARPDGTQNYPQCINLWVAGGSGGNGVATSSGPNLSVGKGSGVPATRLYKTTDPGISVDVSKPLSTYIIPGPPVVSGAAPVPMASQTKAVLKGNGTPLLVQGTTAVPFPATTATKETARRRAEMVGGAGIVL